jgi:hypothetical protein
MIKSGDSVQLLNVTNKNSYEKYQGLKGVVEGELRVRVRYPNGKTIYPYAIDVIKIEEDVMGEFEKGDRVEVVGQPRCRDGHPINIMGKIISKEYSDDEMDNIYFVRSLNEESWYYNKSSLKLITKGDDMEIEAGQVWERLAGPYKGVGVEVLSIGSYGIRYLWADDGEKTTRSKLDFLEKFKLITNIEGVKKMTKAKGIKLKLGMEVKNNGYEGKILYISPQQTVFDCNGTHRSCKTDDLEIVFQLPTEPLNPKAPKKTKKKAVTKKKKVK